MNCHAQVWSDSPTLESVRESLAANVPLIWARVYDLPDFVYFNHGIHVHKGVGCVTCHGPVDRMPLTWKAETLQMDWCLECHRNPEAYLRPRERVFDMAWAPGPDDASGEDLASEYGVEPLLDCSTCHR